MKLIDMHFVSNEIWGKMRAKILPNDWERSFYLPIESSIMPVHRRELIVYLRDVMYYCVHGDEK